MGHSWGGLVAAAWAAAHLESVGRLVVIDGYPGSIDGSGSVVDYDAAHAERERAYARHASEPWYGAAVRALAEEEEHGQGWDEEIWDLPLRSSLADVLRVSRLAAGCAASRAGQGRSADKYGHVQRMVR
jgi:pimeloyl-ACP methyl ester carboxylesterase